MSQATRPNDRHIIWSNQNLDVDDWREDYKEFLEANELDDDPNDEQALYEWMEDGKVTAGTHEQILEKFPEYARLYEAQADGADAHFRPIIHILQSCIFL